MVDTSADLQLSHDLLPPGEVAVLSQSGNVVLDLAALLGDRGLGVSRFVSLGNQADLTVVDLMAACVDHDATRAVAIYAEDVVDGRASSPRRERSPLSGKPVVLMAPGRSAAAVRSAVSHTGSLTSAYRVVDAACAAAGAHRVDNPTQMADLLAGTARPTAGCPAAGSRSSPTAAATVRIAGDALAAVGLETPVLAEDTGSSLRAALCAELHGHQPGRPGRCGRARPDGLCPRASTTLLAADEVDGVLMTGYFGGYSTQAVRAGPARGRRRAGDGRRRGRAVQAGRGAHDLPRRPDLGRCCVAAGIPVHRDVDRAAAVLAGLVERPAGERTRCASRPPRRR